MNFNKVWKLSHGRTWSEGGRCRKKNRVFLWICPGFRYGVQGQRFLNICLLLDIGCMCGGRLSQCYDSLRDFIDNYRRSTHDSLTRVSPILQPDQPVLEILDYRWRSLSWICVSGSWAEWHRGVIMINYCIFFYHKNWLFQYKSQPLNQFSVPAICSNLEKYSDNAMVVD